MTLILHENQIVDTKENACHQLGSDVCFINSTGKHVKPMHFRNSDRAREVIQLIACAIHAGDSILDLDI